jgi:uncharacterized membrane-anchored protein
MRKVVVVLAGVALLVFVNSTIVSRERLIEDGRVVLLELAPLDPRSLMQGDYMALQFRAARDGLPAGASRSTGLDGHLVLAQDARGVAVFRRLDDGAPLGPDEVRMRYRVRHGIPKLATNAWFFEEGHAGDYARARYGELRVAPDGEAILTGLRGEGFERLGKAPTEARYGR